MLPYISNSLYVVFGAAFFTLLTQIRWPKIRLQTERQKGGGGRPDMAQAGGPDGAKADAALAAIEKAMAGA